MKRKRPKQKIRCTLCNRLFPWNSLLPKKGVFVICPRCLVNRIEAKERSENMFLMEIQQLMNTINEARKSSDSNKQYEATCFFCKTVHKTAVPIITSPNTSFICDDCLYRRRKEVFEELSEEESEAIE